jgi:hypothetical protein
MSFKRAVANMIESFKDAMEGQDLAQMREEFAGMLPRARILWCCSCWAPSPATSEARASTRRG